MTAATQQARTVSPSGASSANGRKWLEEISTAIKSTPSRIILHGVPGIGKTSFAAQIPGVAFLCDELESGIHQLKDAGLVSADIPVFPAMTNFDNVLDTLESLRVGDHSLKALATDTLGGMERLCHERECTKNYSGNMTGEGFMAYQKGYDTSLTPWRQYLIALDRLRLERKMRIIMLAHSKVKSHKNPTGPDYDRYEVMCHEKTWALTCQWVDMVLFANYEVAFSASDETKKKAKARGGQTRILHCEHHAAWDAKNRHNLPEEIDMGSSAAEAWANLVEAIKKGRKV